MPDAQHERMRAVRLTLPVMCGYLFFGHGVRRGT